MCLPSVSIHMVGPELKPMVSHSELRKRIQKQAIELYEKHLFEHNVSKDDIKEFIIDFRQNSTIEHVVSVEQHLSDDLVRDWDVLEQYTAETPLQLLRMKAEQKYFSKLEEYLVKINDINDENWFDLSAQLEEYLVEINEGQS